MYITSWLFFFFEFFCANFGYLCPQKLFFKINFVLNFFISQRFCLQLLLVKFLIIFCFQIIATKFLFLLNILQFFVSKFCEQTKFCLTNFFPKYFFQSFNKLYTHLLFGSFFYKFLKFLHIFPSKLLLSNFCFLHTFSYRMQGAR